MAVEKAGFASAIAVPLLAQDRLLGLLCVYGGHDRNTLEEDDLELASILGATAAMGYSNALAFRQLQDSNTGLESAVDQRTDELKTTLDEVRRLNAELSRLDRIKNELISRVAAQLNPPVSSLVTAAGALGSLHGAPPEKTARFLDIIQKQADSLAEIMENVGQASLLATEPGAAKRHVASLPEILRRAVAPLKDLAKQLEVEIKVLSPGNLETITCDADAISTALRAVIKNALEHNRAGGEVRIEVRRVLRRSEPWIEFKISDTGDGIPEADLHRVFEAFWQGAPGARGESRGIGLGLMITKQVVERHGGRISIARRESVGTEVSMTLPQ
jgi:signal transduction histidine kinase